MPPPCGWEKRGQIIFVIAFIVCGLLGFRTAPPAMRLAAEGPLSSTNTHLAATLGAPALAEEIARRCLGLKTAQPLVVFFCAEPPQLTLAAQLISTVAWPREVLLVERGRRESEAMARAAMAREPEALFCLGVAPPAQFGAATELSERCTFVQRSEVGP